MNVAFVKNNIKNIFKSRKESLYALSLYYAALAINYFRSVQPPKPDSQGLFWHNRTGQAAARMFTEAFQKSNYVGWLMAHGVQYGTYLELCNDRRDAAINPVMGIYTQYYLFDANNLYGPG